MTSSRYDKLSLFYYTVILSQRTQPFQMTLAMQMESCFCEWVSWHLWPRWPCPWHVTAHI